MMNQPHLIELLQQLLPSHPEIRLIYLFGSQVKGETGPLSDIDLGVWVEGDIDEVSLLASLSSQLAQKMPDLRWQLVSLRRATIELAYAIIAAGICLYESSTAARVEYEARVLGQYGDYLPVLRSQQAEILKGDDYETRVQRYRAALGRTERTLGEIATAKR